MQFTAVDRIKITKQALQLVMTNPAIYQDRYKPDPKSEGKASMFLNSETAQWCAIHLLLGNIWRFENGQKMPKQVKPSPYIKVKATPKKVVFGETFLVLKMPLVEVEGQTNTNSGRHNLKRETSH